MGPDRNTLQRLISEDEGNYCFGCGGANPHGLRMIYYADKAALYSWVLPHEHMCGWENVVHGGIQSAILDDIMGCGATFLTKRMPMTKEITLRFKKPILLDRGELLAESRILERLSEREVVMEGKIYQGDSEPCVISRGKFGLFKVEDIGLLGLSSETSIGWHRFLIEPAACSSAFEGE